MSFDLDHYISDFDQLQKNDNWFSEQRQSALNLFKETGFPSSRQEDWRYTDVRPIAKKKFSNIHEHAISLSNKEVDAVRFQGLDCIELVFINGVICLQT
jgi:Fe-S cluster assembly protein SufD